MTDPERSARDVLDRACVEVELDSTGATTVRLGENAIFRLRKGIIARVARDGQLVAASCEVAVARWMERVGVPAAQVSEPPYEQPVDIGGRAVTFWRELPSHEHGTPVQVAQALRRLHNIEPPIEIGLGPIEPFVRLSDRIDRASGLSDSDRSWLRDRLAELSRCWKDRPVGLPECVVHGDAWVGNVVSTNGQVIFLDLERTALGSPEWDLVHTAIKYSSFGWISEADYQAFCQEYGHDVTEWAGFELFRDIREFRMTCSAVQAAAERQGGQAQAMHRIECLRGEHGARPWSGWTALP